MGCTASSDVPVAVASTKRPKETTDDDDDKHESQVREPSSLPSPPVSPSSIISISMGDLTPYTAPSPPLFVPSPLLNTHDAHYNVWMLQPSSSPSSSPAPPPEFATLSSSSDEDHEWRLTHNKRVAQRKPRTASTVTSGSGASSRTETKKEGATDRTGTSDAATATVTATATAVPPLVLPPLPPLPPVTTSGINGRSLRAVHGYMHGRYIVDYHIFEPRFHTPYHDDCHALVGLVTADLTGFGLSGHGTLFALSLGDPYDRMSQKLAAVERPNQPSAIRVSGDDKRSHATIRFILNLFIDNIEIWYNGQRQGVFTLEQLKLPSIKSRQSSAIYPVYHSTNDYESLGIRLDASLVYDPYFMGHPHHGYYHVIDGIVYPLALQARPRHNRNGWYKIHQSDDIRYLHDGCTLAYGCGDTESNTNRDWRVYRALYGYQSGAHHYIDFHIARGTPMSSYMIGLVMSTFDWDGSAYDPMTCATGFLYHQGWFYCRGKPVLQLPPLLDHTRLRMVLDLTTHTLTVYYDDDAHARMKPIALKDVGLPEHRWHDRTVIYPVCYITRDGDVRSSSSCVITLDAPLDGSMGHYRSPIVSPSPSSSSPSSPITTVTESKDSKTAVNTSFSSSSSSLKIPTRYPLVSFGDHNNNGTSRLSMSVRSQPDSDDIMIDMDDAITATTSRSSDTGWPVTIHDYELIERIGRRRNPGPGSRFYGANAAVYRARLKPHAREHARASDATALCDADFAIKICYHQDYTATVDAIATVIKRELNLFNRIRGHHAHLVRMNHYFTDVLPSSSPSPSSVVVAPDWDADPTLMAPQAVYVVMQLCRVSLQNVMSHRKAMFGDTEPTRALFRPDEVLLVAQHISCALCVLNHELVAHRDIKPDNILISFPSHLSYKQVMNDLCQPGVTIALADFGEMCDFKANEQKTMSMMFPVGMPRGGAPNTIAPEISFARDDTPVLLDYTKADVWSLGVILATMMTTTQFLRHHNTSVMGMDKRLLAGALVSTSASSSSSQRAASFMGRCHELITNMVAVSPNERWSCYDVYGKLGDASPIAS